MSERLANRLIEPRSERSGLRIDTLIAMRWTAVAGQTVAVGVVVLVFGFEVPLAACAATIAAAAGLNVGLALARRRQEPRLSTLSAVALLGFDTVQFSVLLALTGGLENPFAFICIAPVIVSAASLGLQATLGLAALTTVSLSFVGFFHVHLSWAIGERLHLPELYLLGVWVALVSSLAFLAYYSWRVSEEARRMQEALAATEMVLARECRLSALDGLAAAAAHDLRTPLSTIAVVAQDLGRELDHAPSVAEDLALLRGEIKRCRTILATLADQGSRAMLAELPLSDALEGIAEAARGRGRGTELEVHVEPDDPDASEPLIARTPVLLHGLGNIVDNAVDFARSLVVITGRWTASEIVVEVADDGPGFAQDVLPRLGEPFISKRDGRSGAARPGRGLGFFIARTLIERSGGKVAAANRLPPDSGAIVRVVWRRSEIDVGRESVAES